MSQPFLIKNPSYQELQAIQWVRDNIVFACPYDGPAENEKEFREQINLFFWHVLNVSIYRSKRNRGELFGETFCPFSYSYGRSVLPLVFGDYRLKTGAVAASKQKRGSNQFNRALDWLIENVFDVKRKKLGKNGQPGKCREYRVKRFHLEQMYPVVPRTRYDLLNTVRLYSPLKAPQSRFGYTIIERIHAAAKKKFTMRKHDLSPIDKNSGREVKRYYKQVLDVLAPNEILIDPILAFLEQMSLRNNKKDQKKFQQAMYLLDSILSGPIEIVDEDPLTIRYWPAYKVATKGGRLFEIGGGFQNMPSKLKQACYVVGVNWDMKSSQLNIIKREFAAYNIPCALVENLNSVNELAEMIGESVAMTKKCFYGTVYTLGKILRSEKGQIYASLLESHKGDRAATHAMLDKWDKLTEGLVEGLQILQGLYEKRARRSGNKMYLTCATGTKFSWPLKGPSAKDRRTMLNHIITGLESSYLFEVVRDSSQVRSVYSFEHDGALLQPLRNLSSDYAKFVRKKFSDTIDFTEDSE